MADFIIRGAGEVIRRHRIAAGLSLAELADQAGTDKSQLAKYETNKTGISDTRLWKLAESLAIAPEQLSRECLMFLKPHLQSTPIGQLHETTGSKPTTKAAKSQTENGRLITIRFDWEL